MLALALTAIAVLVGFGYGIYALRLMPTSADRSSVLLAALNLFEPSVTIAVIVSIGFSTSVSNPSDAVPLLLVAGIPMTAMLLAPLVTRAESPLHRMIAVYGALRWVNTVAFWVMGVAALSEISSNTTSTLAGLLMCSGIVILFVSVAQIASSLNGSRVAQKS